MRILIVTQYYPPEVGAPQIRLEAVARTLRNQGHDIEVVTALPNHPTGRIHDGYRGRARMREVVDGIPVNRVWMYPALGSGIHRVMSYLSFAMMLPTAFTRTTRPDLMLIESPPPFIVPVAVLAARRWRVPAVLNVADLWPDVAVDMGALSEGPAARALRRFERWCYRRSDLITTVTEGLAETIIEKKGVRREKVLLMPNGIDPCRFAPGPPDPVMAAELAPEGGPVFLYAGTIGIAHGADVAIRAIARVHATHPEAQLVFMGGGSDRARLEALVAEQSMKAVRFLDPRPPDAVASAMRVALAGVATLRGGSTAESTRLAKMFPPMACARPLLFSGAGEGADIVANAGAGIVTPPGDDEALAQAMLVIIEDPERALLIGAAGRRLVEEQFSWDAIVSRWLVEINEWQSSRSA